MSRIETIKLAIMADPLKIKLIRIEGLSHSLCSSKRLLVSILLDKLRNEDGGSWDLLEG